MTITLLHGKLRHSVSSVNFNFERTYLSRIAYGLRKATHGGLGKTFLVKMTSVHADVSSLIHQKQYEVVGKKSILG